MTNGQTYWYEVNAQNAYGFSANTSAVNATPSITGNPPGTPSGLTASAGNAQVSLSWTAPTTGVAIANYNVYRSTTQNGTYIVIASPTTTSYTDTGLTNEHVYWYKVNAQNSYGFSSNTTEVSATPTAPANGSGSGTGNSDNMLTWIGIAVVIIIVVIVILALVLLARKKKPKEADVISKEKASEAKAGDNPSAEDRLKKLKEMRDKGLITEQDYEIKKKEILSAI